jgi:hypothetical protein
MPITTETGVYVPDIGESMASWPAHVNQNFLLLDQALAYSIPAAMPTVYVSRPSVTAASSDTNKRRGSFWTPYAGVEQVLKELNGASPAGPGVVAGQPLHIKILPGPVNNYPTIPTGGYLTSQTFPGQAFPLTQSWNMPLQSVIEGCGGTNMSPTPATYNTLLYGNVAGSLIRFGGPGYTDVPSTTLQNLAVCNLGGTGVEIVEGTTSLLNRVTPWGCKNNGFLMTKHAADAVMLLFCISNFNGTSGVGWGLEVAPGGLGPMNEFICFGSKFQRNGNWVSGAEDLLSGEIHLLADTVAGTSGLGWAFLSCRIGTGHVVVDGAKGGLFDYCYIEGGDDRSDAQFIFDSYGNGVRGATSNHEYFPRNIEIRRSFIHGGANTPGLARNVHVKKGIDIRVVNNTHCANIATDGTNPYVWFDDTWTRICRADILSGIRENHTGAVAGTGGVNLCHIGHSSNYGLYNAYNGTAFSDAIAKYNAGVF